MKPGTSWLWRLGAGAAALSPVVNFVGYRIVQNRIAEFVGTLQPVGVESSETVDWSFIFESDRSRFQLNMTLLEAENGEPMWGGFSLRAMQLQKTFNGWLERSKRLLEAFGFMMTNAECMLPKIFRLLAEEDRIDRSRRPYVASGGGRTAWDQRTWLWRVLPAGNSKSGGRPRHPNDPGLSGLRRGSV